MSWTDGLDLRRALANLEQEKKGDWYRDPWGWPEYEFLGSDDGGTLLRSRVASNAALAEPSPIEVPKENFGVRPAVVLGIVDRVTYQVLVDSLSKSLIGSLAPDVYGWRLPIDAAKPGHYARQDFQWLEYRSKLSVMADVFDFGLKTDISTFFSSIDPERVVSQLSTSGGDPRAIDRLNRVLLGLRVHNPRPGLPQRSTASAVLANMMLRKLDQTLKDVATPVGRFANRAGERFSFARWMDDIWIFSEDDGDLRASQVDVQRQLTSLGLSLNSAKTRLLYGSDLDEATKKIQSSAVDGALEDSPPNRRPLEELVDQIIDEREASDRSVVRFVSSRMRTHNVAYKLGDLLRVGVRMPHAADHLGRLFRHGVASSEMQDWLQDYVASSWNKFEWATAQFATSIPQGRAPRRSTRDLYFGFLTQVGASVPLVAVAAQRLSSWDPKQALEAIEARAVTDPSSQNVRVLSLAALQAGAPKSTIKRWLALHDENYLTLLMLEARGFTPPPPSRDYR